MRIDALHRFSVAQSIAASVVSQNVIDLGADRNIGIGDPMDVAIYVTTQLDGTTNDESYLAQLQTSVDEAFSSPIAVGPPVQLRTGADGLLGGAGVHAPVGTKKIIPIPPDLQTARFLRISYTVGGTSTSGAVNAHLTKRDFIQAEVVYPKTSGTPTG